MGGRRTRPPANQMADRAVRIIAGFPEDAENFAVFRRRDRQKCQYRRAERPKYDAVLQLSRDEARAVFIDDLRGGGYRQVIHLILDMFHFAEIQKMGNHREKHATRRIPPRA